jgi:hypothetical protein
MYFLLDKIVGGQPPLCQMSNIMGKFFLLFFILGVDFLRGCGILFTQ